MENLIKAIMSQFPVGAKIEITECPVMESNFQLSITKQGFGTHSTIPKDISNTAFFGVITQQISQFNLEELKKP